MPGIVERHTVGISRIMLAGTVAGEAPASAIIRDLLKNDETLKLPKAEEVEIAPLIDTSKRSADEQAEVREKRKAMKKAKQEAERALRENAQLVPAILYVAEMDLGDGKYDAARERIDAALAVNPRHAVARSTSAALHYL